MDSDIASQLDRAKVLLCEFIECCKHDLGSNSVSPNTENLAQEVLLKIRHVLDQALHRFFEKHYVPNLSEKDIKRSKIYFPIVGKRESLQGVFRRGKMESLPQDFPEIFRFIESVQP